MTAHENNFGFMINENSVKIPFFQRKYVWGEDEWEQLFEDLLDSFNTKKEHFLGSIILKQLPTQAGEGSHRSLIDGQQRLTTFSILIKCLYDKLAENIKQDYNYRAYLFQQPYSSKKPKIKHSQIDSQSFEKVFKATSTTEIDDIDDRILKCYKYFDLRVGKEINDFQGFMNFILEKSKLWVVINLGQDEDEQKIFDSINSTGVKLTATDIIKNTLFDKAIKLQTNYETLYKDYWENVFEGEKKEKMAFWDSEVATGRLKRTQSEIFLHAFAIIKGFFDAEKSLEKLSASYKDEIKKLDKNSIDTFLKELKQYADIYFNFPKIVFRDDKIFRDDKKDGKKATNFTFSNYELRLFHILKVADINTIMPLLLKLKALYNKDEKILKECYEILEIFIINCYISNVTTKDYNKLFAKMTLELDKKNPLNSIKEHLKQRTVAPLPNRAQTEDSLNFINNKRATLVLFWIELFRLNNPKRFVDSKELNYTYQLEHLMPQEWRINWADIGKDDENANRLIYQIGNMTLLNGSLNASISNAKWYIKLNGDDSKKNCIKKCARLLITQEDIVEKNIEEWNATEIETRTKNLIKEFFEIWDITKLNN